MKTILTLGASSSQNSINKQLATWIAGQIADSKIESLDLNDYEMPLYSIDRENEHGIPELALKFAEKIKSSDGVVISLAEHNGSYSAAFKNLLDWTSRHQQKLWAEKPMLLAATSPGGRGGQSVLQAALQTFPRMGANIVSSLSVPSFYENFSDGNITNPEITEQLRACTGKLMDAITASS